MHLPVTCLEAATKLFQKLVVGMALEEFPIILTAQTGRIERTALGIPDIAIPGVACLVVRKEWFGHHASMSA
jgi:hypothetical protein